MTGHMQVRRRCPTSNEMTGQSKLGYPGLMQCLTEHVDNWVHVFLIPSILSFRWHLKSTRHEAKHIPSVVCSKLGARGGSSSVYVQCGLLYC